jgi:hypothetical protein
MAARYQVSVRTIDDWCGAGTLPFYKHGGVDADDDEVPTSFGLGPTVASAPEVLPFVGGGGGGGLTRSQRGARTVQWSQWFRNGHPLPRCI